MRFAWEPFARARFSVHCAAELAGAGWLLLLLDEDGAKFFRHQELYASRDGPGYRELPGEWQEGALTCALDEGGDVYLATRPSYGRDALDRLLAAGEDPAPGLLERSVVRIEITTAAGPDVFPPIGRGLLARAAEVDDWSPALA